MSLSRSSSLITSCISNHPCLFPRQWRHLQVGWWWRCAERGTTRWLFLLERGSRCWTAGGVRVGRAGATTGRRSFSARITPDWPGRGPGPGRGQVVAREEQASPTFDLNSLFLFSPKRCRCRCPIPILNKFMFTSDNSSLVPPVTPVFKFRKLKDSSWCPI